jgi:serine acetyltransferase
MTSQNQVPIRIAVVGAGVVVTRDVPDFALIYDTPGASRAGCAGAGSNWP